MAFRIEGCHTLRSFSVLFSMPYARFPFIRFFTVFLIGMLASMYGVITSLQYMSWIFISLLFLYIVLLLGRRYKRGFDREGIWIATVGLVALASAGAIRFLQYIPALDRHHIVHHAMGVERYEGMVEEKRAYVRYERIVLTLQRIYIEGQWKKVRGKVWLYHPLGANFRYGDLLVIEGTFQEIGVPRNPYAFDYRRFARQQGVYHQAFVSKGEVVRYGYLPRNRILSVAYRLRAYFATRLKKQLSTAASQAIVLAMVLGIRSNMDEEVESAFSTAGILHILAVSGLHVGILYALLLLLLSLLGATGYQRRWLQGIVIFSLLWGYAFVTALSASVVRTVIMCSLFTMAKLFYRRYNFWNQLAITSFIALFYQPLWLTQIGFQLSYLAVIAIHLLFPSIERIFNPTNRVLKRVWQITAISLSVQIVSAPISLYYFHYLPTYFLLGNWLAVPLSSLILCLGLLLCVLGYFSFLSEYIGWLLAALLEGLSYYAKWIEALPWSNIGPFWPSFAEVIGIYSVMISFGFFLRKRKFRYLTIATFSALLCGSLYSYRWYWQKSQEEVIVYSLRQGKAVALIEGKSVVLLLDRCLPGSKVYKREVAPSLGAMGIVSLKVLLFEEEAVDLYDKVRYRIWKGMRVILWKDKKIVWIDRHALLPPRLRVPWQIDVLVVDTYPSASFEPWLSSLRPKKVVIGYGLSRKKRIHLKILLGQKKIPYHDLIEEGAFRSI